MKNYHRATITIPEELYRKAKVQAAYQNKSVSKFITDLLRKQPSGGQHAKRPLPFGKYQLGIKEGLDRKTMYETRLKRKVSR